MEFKLKMATPTPTWISNPTNFGFSSPHNHVNQFLKINQYLPPWYIYIPLYILYILHTHTDVCVCNIGSVSLENPAWYRSILGNPREANSPSSHRKRKDRLRLVETRSVQMPSHQGPQQQALTCTSRPRTLPSVWLCYPLHLYHAPGTGDWLLIC